MYIFVCICLLSRDAAIDAEDDNLMTPLMLATKNEHKEVFLVVVNVYYMSVWMSGNTIVTWLLT